MKTNDEIIDLIKRFAETRPDIFYVIQNGSRVNPNILADQYADYDIIYGCRDYEKYVTDQQWIAYFGVLLLLQRNDIEEHGIRWPIFLMQFTDGLRIDLQFYPGDGLEIYRSDSLSRIVLDKHHLFKDVFEPSESTYITHKPSIEEYCKEVNNFWWCLINVGKGIARNELTYSRFMYESIVRENFLRIMSWYVSSQHQWTINSGKFGKFLRKYADMQTWEAIEHTYETDTNTVFWDSIFHAGNLIKKVDRELRKVLAISFKDENEDMIIAFLEKIRKNEI